MSERVKKDKLVTVGGEITETEHERLLGAAARKGTTVKELVPEILRAWLSARSAPAAEERGGEAEEG